RAFACALHRDRAAVADRCVEFVARLRTRADNEDVPTFEESVSHERRTYPTDADASPEAAEDARALRELVAALVVTGGGVVQRPSDAATAAPPAQALALEAEPLAEDRDTPLDRRGRVRIGERCGSRPDLADLQDELQRVERGVAHLRLRVDGQPGLPLGREHV